MKLRLTQPGFEHYNGQMGVIFFEDGLSKGDVLSLDAVRMAAVMVCEWENGSSPSVAQAILDNADTPAPIFASGADGQHDKEAVGKAKAESIQQDVPKTSAYNYEQLSAIADAQGIKGLRAIAEPLGIKSNSIKELIEAILATGTATY